MDSNYAVAVPMLAAHWSSGYASIVTILLVVMCVLQTIREEAKTTSMYYIAQLIKVDKQTTKNRTRRDERMAAAMRDHAKSRVEFLRERERRATSDVGSNVTTALIPDLQVTRPSPLIQITDLSYNWNCGF